MNCPGVLVLALQGGTEMYRGHDPFFQANRCSLVYQFTINAPLMCQQFQFLDKDFAVSALFWAKISALKTQIFKIFVSQTLHFSRKLCSLDPTFVAHTHQKKVECPLWDSDYAIFTNSTVSIHKWKHL